MYMTLRRTLSRCDLSRFFVSSVLFAWAPFVTAQPTVSRLDPVRGPARTAVSIVGSGLASASVVWDAGTATEAVLPSALQGAVLFGVPPTAAPGVHVVAIEAGGMRSAPIAFEVTIGKTDGRPRVDRVSVVEAEASGPAISRLRLYVQGANMDVGSDVVVNGKNVPAVAHKIVYMNLYGVDPNFLEYPIRHFLSKIVTVENIRWGDMLRISVKNESGEVSEQITYKMPSTAADLDSDGDMLLDSWERNGYDADGDGQRDIDLRSLGANPHKPDVFVEVDVMDGLTNPPSTGALAAVTEMFANAPVLNPFDQSGISLHLDSSGRAPFADVVGFDSRHDPTAGTASFAQLRSDNLSKHRSGIYHYAIWGNAHPNGWSGHSDVDFDVTGVGNDFIVAFDEFPQSFQSRRSQAETFAHELGHNLGQRHGGENHNQYKPNYWSVMSYTWQLRTGRMNAERTNSPTCGPMYYGQPGAVEVNGAIPNISGVRIDYSHGMAAVLDPTALSETVGVCGTAIDWDADGQIAQQPVNAPIGNGLIRDYANWRDLKYHGPRGKNRY
jgi:hypothetical protein